MIQTKIFFSAVFFSFNFCLSKPWIRIRSGSVFSLKCWIRIRIKWIRIRNTGYSTQAKRQNGEKNQKAVLRICCFFKPLDPVSRFPNPYFCELSNKVLGLKVLYFFVNWLTNFPCPIQNWTVFNCDICGYKKVGQQIFSLSSFVAVVRSRLD
jgi:hypothetical protein